MSEKFIEVLCVVCLFAAALSPLAFVVKDMQGPSWRAVDACKSLSEPALRDKCILDIIGGGK